jgi:hypothetical protein
VRDFHQRRLAGTILAHQRMDFAQAHVERDVLEGLDAAERLGNMAHLQK